MATEHITVVDPDMGAGYDYASLALWESDLGDTTGNLPSDDLIAVAKCRSTGGTADTAAVTISGWTTDATRYIKIWCDSAESHRHEGKWSDVKYRLSPVADAHSITIRENYVDIDGLQISTSAPSTIQITCINISGLDAGGSRIRLSNTVYRYISNSGTSPRGIICNDADAAVYVWNGVFYGGFQAAIIHANGTLNAYNCTAFGNGYNYWRLGGTLNCYNCISQDDTTADFSGTIGGDYNLTDEASGAPGANSVHSANLTFVDAGNGDFHLAAGDTAAIDVTSDQSSGLFSNDIDGATRTGSWDIGADEYSSGTPTGISATLESTLPVPSLTATASVQVTASLSSTLPVPALEATASVTVSASASTTLPVPSLEATASLSIGATFSDTIPVPSLEATASVQVTATLDSTLPVPTLEATVETTFPTRTLTLTSTLTVPALEATASLTVNAELASTLPVPALDATASLQVTAEASSVLPVPALTARLQIGQSESADLNVWESAAKEQEWASPSRSNVWTA